MATASYAENRGRIVTRKARFGRPCPGFNLAAYLGGASSAQIAAEALDAAAGILEHLVRGGIRDTEERRQAESGAMHHGDALLLQKRIGEIFVAPDRGSVGGFQPH